MRYYFNCPSKCGQYEVEETLFKQLITRHLQEKLEQSVSSGAIAAELEFKNFCHTCKGVTRRRTPATLHIIRPKKI